MNWDWLRGKWVAIDGLDGCGKTTQVQLLEQRITEHKVPVLRVREPGGTVVGADIRNMLLNSRYPRGSHIRPNTEFLLFCAERAQLVEEVVVPALARGQCVVGDRSLVSSWAYNAWRTTFQMEFRKDLLINSSGLLPDVIFVLDASVETCKLRMAGRSRDNLEARVKEYEFRRNEFLENSLGMVDCFIDGELGISQVHEQVMRALAVAAG